MMTAQRDVGKSKTVVIVSDDAKARGAIRRALAADGRYIIECQIGDLHKLVRSVQIDAISVLGERTNLLVVQLREALSGTRVAVRHISFAESPAEAHDALLRALTSD